MASGHQAGRGKAHCGGLADDDTLDVGLQPSQHPGRPLRHQGRACHYEPGFYSGMDVLAAFRTSLQCITESDTL